MDAVKTLTEENMWVTGLVIFTLRMPATLIRKPNTAVTRFPQTNVFQSQVVLCVMDINSVTSPFRSAKAPRSTFNHDKYE